MSLPVNYFSWKRTLRELFHLDDNNNNRYIEAKVFMVWPPHKKVYCIQLEVTQDSTPHYFTIEIPSRDDIIFHCQDQILLALKGIKLDVQKESNALYLFPLTLHFPDSTVLKYMTGTNAGRLINTHKGMSCIYS